MASNLISTPHIGDPDAGIIKDWVRRWGDLAGAQRPRLWSVPDHTSTAAGEDAAELSAQSGLVLDDWQEWTLAQAMAQNDDHRWAAFEVGLVVSRQNGKNGILEARELAGLFVLHEALIIHTAHEFKAAQEQFRRLRALIETKSFLSKRIKTITTSHGDEAIELLPTPTIIMGSGARMVRKSVAPRLRFLARSRGSGRAFTCNCLVWDESMILTEDQVGAAMPTLSAVADPQLWYTGSAGDLASVQLGRVRARGVRADARRRSGQPSVDPLAFFEWSIDACHEFCEPLCPQHGEDTTACSSYCPPAVCPKHDDPQNPRSWAKANPGLGIRISVEHVNREMASMSPHGVQVCPPDVFARERLGVGQWPSEEDGWAVISESMWDAAADPTSPRPAGAIAIAADVTPDQQAGAISIAGARPDGKIICEIPEGDHRGGTAWIVPRLKQLHRALKPVAIVIDRRSPAGTIIDEAEKAGLEIVSPNTNEVASAFGLFYVGVGDRQVLHLGHELQPDLRSAVAGAAKREVGDGAFAWARKSTTVDISPLVAATLAVWANGKFGARKYDVLKSFH